MPSPTKSAQATSCQQGDLNRPLPSSMPYQQRIRYAVFVDNQAMIESDWDADFGDRKNEIVFIGQDMDETRIRRELEACLATDEELSTGEWKQGYEDEWPVQRAYPVG